MRYQSFARARRFGSRSVGNAVAVFFSGISAAILLALLILTLPLLAELLSSGGSVAIPAAESSAISKLGVTPVSADAKYALFEHAGMLPTLWRLRNSWLSPSVRQLYESLTPLRSNQGYLLTLIATVWALSLLAAAALYWMEIVIQRAACRVVSALRQQIHSQAHRLGAGDLFIGQKLISVELFTHKTDAVQSGLVAWWRALPHAACFALFMMGLALAVDFWLALSTVLLVIISWWIFSELRRRARQKGGVLAGRGGQVSKMLIEHLQQNRLLGNWSTNGPSDSKSFADHLRRFEDMVLEQATTTSMLSPLITFFVLLVVGVVLLLAGFNVLRESPRLSLAELVLLGSALLAMVYPLVRFERLAEVLPEADQAAADVFTYLDREPRIGQLPDAAPLESLSHQIALDHVTLADISGRLLLDDVSCSIPAGSQVAIFSSNDATSLAMGGLLPRFCDPAAGQVLFDNRDLRLATIDSVRRQVSLLLPENLIAGGTLAENIVGDDRHFGSDDILAAVKLAHAYEFVQSLPEGLETMVGPNGLTLSAGQAIRVGLARVALRRPSVVVIEEPREVLDQVTAERVADALERVTKGRTLVILARRLATLRAAQRVLLFHEGRLLADGTHQELLQHNDLYRHLNYVRFNEFRDKVR
jgi:ATP-binding cassette, subfamily B, bacterial